MDALLRMMLNQARTDAVLIFFPRWVMKNGLLDFVMLTNGILSL